MRMGDAFWLEWPRAATFFRALILVIPILGLKTVQQRISETQPQFELGLAPALRHAGFAQLPGNIVLLYLKDVKMLTLYAREFRSRLRFVKAYPVLAASGSWGPKLREGDLQVPEGIYPIDTLNPNSSFYLSMRVGYPNRGDRHQAGLENRVGLGGNIMIHGGAASVGCISIGDEAVAEIFHLAAITPLSRWKLLVAPVDLRFTANPPEVTDVLPWMNNVYDRLRREMERLP